MYSLSVGKSSCWSAHLECYFYMYFHCSLITNNPTIDEKMKNRVELNKCDCSNKLKFIEQVQNSGVGYVAEK